MLTFIPRRLRRSPSTAISLLAVLIVLGGGGYAATGGNWILGRSNSATTPTGLTANVNGRALAINNPSTGASATALSLAVTAGKPPLITNSNTRVTNLNSDLLDGLDSSDFAQVGNVNAQFFNGLSSSAYARSRSEDWHYIGDPGEPAFQNGWSNYDASATHDGATWQHAAYRKDSFGVVHLRGLVKGGVIGQPIFTLSFTYCPWYYHAFPVISNNALARITVQYVQPTCGVYADFGSNAWISLEGVSYQEWPTEQLNAAAPQMASVPIPDHVSPGAVSLRRNTGVR
jgi:hypothetical protein